MALYEVRNPNGSLVFVDGLRVKPYSSVHVDIGSSTVLELRRFGCTTTLVASEEPVEEVAPVKAAPKRTKKKKKPAKKQTASPEPAKVPESEPAPTLEEFEAVDTASVDAASVVVEEEQELVTSAEVMNEDPSPTVEGLVELDPSVEEIPVEKPKPKRRRRRKKAASEDTGHSDE